MNTLFTPFVTPETHTWPTLLFPCVGTSSHGIWALTASIRQPGANALLNFTWALICFAGLPPLPYPVQICTCMAHLITLRLEYLERKGRERESLTFFSSHDIIIDLLSHCLSSPSFAPFSGKFVRPRTYLPWNRHSNIHWMNKSEWVSKRKHGNFSWFVPWK